jgi:hypothetical protein
MAFDAKVFASWNVRARLILREMLRRDEFRQVAPNLAPVWANSLSELTNLIKKVTEGMLNRLSEEEIAGLTKQVNPELDSKTVLLLALVKRLQAFPHSLHYLVGKNGTVLIFSDDRYLEGALYFGTRQLPRLRPIDFLVSRMALRLRDPSIVFTARDFRKAHETDKEFKRENLRTVSPHYS